MMPKIVINFFAAIGMMSTMFFVIGGISMLYEIRHAREVEDENK